MVKALTKIEGFLSSRHNFRLILLILFFSILIIITASSFVRKFEHDELEAVHTAWKIYQGEQIYTDFFQHHHPLLYFITVPILWLFGGATAALIAFRTSMLLTFLLILGFTFQTAKIIGNNLIAFLSVLLLASNVTFVNRSIEVRPDTPMVFLILVSSFFLLKYLSGGNRRQLILSALAGTLAFLILQKAIFFLILIGVILSHGWITQKVPTRDVLLFSTTVLITLLPFTLYLTHQGILDEYFLLNWTLNIHFLNEFSPRNTIRTAYLENSVQFFFFGMGLVLSLREKKWRIINFLAIGLLLSILFTRSPYPQYLAPAFPFIAIIAAAALVEIFHRREALLGVALLLTVAYPSSLLARQTLDTNFSQLEKIKYVLSVTDPADHVYDGDIRFNLFRQDLDFFWYSVKPKRGLRTYQTLTDYHYNIYELIDHFQPKVISTFEIGNLSDPQIKDHYQPSPKYNDLYIRQGD